MSVGDGRCVKSFSEDFRQWDRGLRGREVSDVEVVLARRQVVRVARSVEEEREFMEMLGL